MCCVGQKIGDVGSTPQFRAVAKPMVTELPRQKGLPGGMQGTDPGAAGPGEKSISLLTHEEGLRVGEYEKVGWEQRTVRPLALGGRCQ